MPAIAQRVPTESCMGWFGTIADAVRSCEGPIDGVPAGAVG